MNRPVFGTKEWASSNINIQFGCQHDCRYCYAKAMSVRHKKIDIDSWNKPVLRQDVINKKFGKRQGTIMFPTTHDLHPDQIPEILHVLHSILKPDNHILIVSKPHFKVVKNICDRFCSWPDNYKDQILFRFTIGSMDPDVISFWEPGAPGVEERLSSLQYAFFKGFQTSVSAEPMLDADIDRLIESVRDSVSDSIWLGKINDPIRRCKINGETFETPEAQEFLMRATFWDRDEHVFDLYNRYQGDPMIKWKESIKKVVGLEVPTQIGLDV